MNGRHVWWSLSRPVGSVDYEGGGWGWRQSHIEHHQAAVEGHR